MMDICAIFNKNVPYFTIENNDYVVLFLNTFRLKKFWVCHLAPGSGICFFFRSPGTRLGQVDHKILQMTF